MTLHLKIRKCLFTHCILNSFLVINISSDPCFIKTWIFLRHFGIGRDNHLTSIAMADNLSQLVQTADLGLFNRLTIAEQMLLRAPLPEIQADLAESYQRPRWRRWIHTISSWFHDNHFHDEADFEAEMRDVLVRTLKFMKKHANPQNRVTVTGWQQRNGGLTRILLGRIPKGWRNKDEGAIKVIVSPCQNDQTNVVAKVVFHQQPLSQTGKKLVRELFKSIQEP
jgi:hypothetical protein